jgi:predicted SnoaL-like aldol condensation-catalyzing enzyme
MWRSRAGTWLGLATAALVAACGQALGPAPIAGPPVPVAAHPDPFAALASSDPALAANKRMVFDLWRTVVNAGQVEAADDMLAEDYIQHSPVLPTGRKAFKQIFSAVPRREVPVLVEPPLVASIGEGNLVVMSLLERVAATADSPAFITTHFNLFRIEDGRLAEHWHSVRTPPGANVPLPENGGPRPVTGASGAAQEALLAASQPQLARNKRLVFDMWRTLVEAGAEEQAADFFAAGFIDHSPAGASGLGGVQSRFAARADATLQPWIRAPMVAVVAEGDLVAMVTMQELPHPVHAGRSYTVTWFNQFRITDGRIVEHWDAATPADPAAGPGW